MGFDDQFDVPAALPSGKKTLTLEKCFERNSDISSGVATYRKLLWICVEFAMLKQKHVYATQMLCNDTALPTGSTLWCI